LLGGVFYRSAASGSTASGDLPACRCLFQGPRLAFPVPHRHAAGHGFRLATGFLRGDTLNYPVQIAQGVLSVEQVRGLAWVETG